MNMTPDSAAWLTRYSLARVSLPRYLLQAGALVSALFTLTLGLVVLIGWQIGRQDLIAVATQYVPIQRNTALCFLLAGVGLIAALGNGRRLTTLIGAIVLLVGTTSLLGDLTGTDLALARFLIPDALQRDVPLPENMAPNSALSFMLLAATYLLYPMRSASARRVLGCAVLASVVFGLGAVAFIGHITSLQAAYAWGEWTHMARHASIGFMVVSIGVLLGLWEHDRSLGAIIPIWMPAPTLISTATLFFFFWIALETEGRRIAETYAELSSITGLATLILLIGLLLAVALATAVHLTRKTIIRTRLLVTTNETLGAEVATRQAAEQELLQHRNHLEELVEARTGELETARQEAEAANRTKSDFLAHMSHELRTPLNGILGYSQILQRDAATTINQQESLAAIGNCGRHLLALINDVLDLSKIEAGRLDVDLAPCELRPVIEAVVDMMRLRAREKGLKIDVTVDRAVPTGIWTDAAKLRQILINLTSNAVKFTQAGSVMVTIVPTEEQLLFQVRDSGVGIAPDQFEDVFDPFKQLEAGKAFGGTGLGLAITRELVTALEGTIKLESTQGEGTTFTVTLPLRAVPIVRTEAIPSPGVTEEAWPRIVTPPQPAPDTEAARSGDIGCRLPAGMQTRLGEALKIKHITALKALAMELKQSPTTATFADHFEARLAAFDFAALQHLIDATEEEESHD
jgi:signal transduction histidine kinase